MITKVSKIRYSSDPQKGGRYWILETADGIVKGKKRVKYFSRRLHRSFRKLDSFKI